MIVSRRWLEALLARPLEAKDVAERLAMLCAPVDAVVPLHQDLRDVLIGVAKGLLRNGPREAPPDGHTLWALRDGSFGDDLMKIVMLRGTFIFIQRNRN